MGYLTLKYFFKIALLIPEISAFKPTKQILQLDILLFIYLMI